MSPLVLPLLAPLTFPREFLPPSAPTLDSCARHLGNLKTSYRSIVLAFFETRKLRFPWQVRPFTLGQLKELLGRTGTLVEEAFWIDKIKSHCFVTVRGGS